MEKAFKLSKESKLYKDYKKYLDDCNYQKECVKEFFETNGIETKKYYVGGNGLYGVPFKEYEKKDIRLGLVEPTESDILKFGNMFCKERENKLFRLKKNSKLNKQFQDFTIEKQIVVNIWEPDMRYYFKSLQCKGYSLLITKDKDDYWYIKLSSDMLKDDDIPEGLEEIKLSEFYKIREEYKEDK